MLERGFNQNYGEPMTLAWRGALAEGRDRAAVRKVAALEMAKVPVENLYGAGGATRRRRRGPKFGPEIGYQERELFGGFSNCRLQRRIARDHRGFLEVGGPVVRASGLVKPASDLGLGRQSAEGRLSPILCSSPHRAAISLKKMLTISNRPKSG